MIDFMSGQSVSTIAWNRYKQWLESACFDTATKEELRAVQDSADINERFSEVLSFGTGGIRGLMGAGTNRINRYTVRRVGYGIANWLNEAAGNLARTVVIAHDTRLHSEEYAREIAETIAGCGIFVRLFSSATPTPMLSFATWFTRADAGIMITASHNTKEYNGIKVYDADGVQLTPDKANVVSEKCNQIANVIEKPVFNPDWITSVGTEVIDAFFAQVLTQSRRQQRGSSALRIVYTPLHGAGAAPVMRILETDGFRMIFPVREQYEPNGLFPTVSAPNPEKSDALHMGIQLGHDKNADIVLGTDADCDRLGVAVRHGGDYRLLSGNQIAAILLRFLVDTGKNLRGRNCVLVKTIVTGDLCKKIATGNGIHVQETLVGFKYIGQKVVDILRDPELHFLLGCEESYGYLVGSHARDKDAVVAAMLICEAADYYLLQGMTLVDVLDDLYAQYGYYYEQQKVYRLDGTLKHIYKDSCMVYLRNCGASLFPNCLEMHDYMTDAGELPKDNLLKWKLNDGTWIAVRPSGTEPILKTYYAICGKDEDNAMARYDSLMQILDDAIQRSSRE